MKRRNLAITFLLAPIFLTLCSSFIEANDVVSEIRLLGSNSPTGSQYDEVILLDGGTQSVANDSLTATAEIFDLANGDFSFQVTYESTANGFVADVDESWFANYRLSYNRATANSKTFFWYEDAAGPIDLSFNGWGGDIVQHPFDLTILEVASFNTFRDFEFEHQLGIFSNPFTSLTDELGVDASSVTGFGLGVVLSSVPEPGSTSLLTAAILLGCLRRKRWQS